MKKEIENRIEELEKIEADHKKTYEERVDATIEKMKLIKKLKEEEEDFTPYDLNTLGGHIPMRDNTYSPYDLNSVGINKKK